MKRSLYLYIFAAMTAAVALYFVLFAPPRIGTHGDIPRDSRPTEIRNPSIIVNYVFFRGQTGNERIGTMPYNDYYVRTYAAELWMLAGLLLIAGTVAQRRELKSRR